MQHFSFKVPAAVSKLQLMTDTDVLEPRMLLQHQETNSGSTGICMETLLIDDHSSLLKLDFDILVFFFISLITEHFKKCFHYYTFYTKKYKIVESINILYLSNFLVLFQNSILYLTELGVAKSECMLNQNIFCWTGPLKYSTHFATTIYMAICVPHLKQMLVRWA